jgi:hypothetical protein
MWGGSPFETICRTTVYTPASISRELHRAGSRSEAAEASAPRMSWFVVFEGEVRTGDAGSVVLVALRPSRAHRAAFRELLTRVAMVRS